MPEESTESGPKGDDKSGGGTKKKLPVPAMTARIAAANKKKQD